MDAANVVGSKPDGWWRDRAGAATRLRDALVRADLPYETVVLVLEGQAKKSTPAGSFEGLLVVRAPKEGDDEIVAQAQHYVERGDDVDVPTSDHGLRERLVAVGATPTSVGDLRHRIGY